MHSKHQPPPGRKTFCSQHGWHESPIPLVSKRLEPPANHPMTTPTPLAYWLNPEKYVYYGPLTYSEQMLKEIRAARKVQYPHSCVPDVYAVDIRGEKCFHARWNDPRLLEMLEILEAKLGQLHIRYGGREKDLGTATWFTCYEQPVWEPEHAGLGFEEGPPDFVLWLHEQEFDLRIDGSVKELKRKCFRETARTDWNGDTLVGY